MQALLAPNVLGIVSPAATPRRDCAPDSLAAGTPRKLRDDLCDLLGADRVLARPIDLIRYATDASPYRLFPKARRDRARHARTCARCSSYARRNDTKA